MENRIKELEKQNNLLKIEIDILKKYIKDEREKRYGKSNRKL